MEDFLSFRKMLTPIIIQVLFWIGVLATVISGLVMMTQGGSNIAMGVLSIVLGPIIVRIYCELLIVIFRINDTLTEIKNSKSSQSPPPQQ